MPERSSITFWLVLAATILVDAVVLPLAAARVPGPLIVYSLYAKLAVDALIVSQLCAICIWATLSSSKVVWVPIIVATFVAALAASVFERADIGLSDNLKVFLSYYGLVATLLLSVLWLFRATKYWRRRCGVDHSWQYSLAQLLIAMTVAAVLMSLVRSGPFEGNDGVVNLVLIASIVAVAAGCVVIWSSSQHALLRFAGTLGWAILVSIAFGVVTYGSPFSFTLAVHFLIQAIVLSAWLGFGQILPAKQPAP